MVVFRCNSCSKELNTSFFSAAPVRNPEVLQPGFVTDCKHLYCQSCKTKYNKCTICKRSCNFLAVDANLPADFRHFFTPTKELFPKYQAAKAFQARLDKVNRHVLREMSKYYRVKDPEKIRLQKANDQKASWVDVDTKKLPAENSYQEYEQ